MDSGSLQQLQELNERLGDAIKTLAASSSNSRRTVLNPDKPRTKDNVAANAEAQEQEINKAKTTILGCVSEIRNLVVRPADFLQHLASQIEVLACLRWLAEFQILACIPVPIPTPTATTTPTPTSTEKGFSLLTSVPISDVADLTGVSESQLTRVIRLTATSGFLHEPRPGQVAHTVLSARFVTDQSLLDAVVFAGDIVGPAALYMPSASATQRFFSSSSSSSTSSSSRHHNNISSGNSSGSGGGSGNGNETAYNLALGTTRSFHAARLDRPKLARQWSAYLTHAAGVHGDDEIVQVFSRLSWSNLGSASIVEVNAPSTSLSRRLARRFPGLHLVVQLIKGVTDGSAENDMDNEHVSSSCITVTHRIPGTVQSITDAAVYIYHLPASASGPNVNAVVRAELQHYLGVLRVSGGVMLILTTRLLPDSSSASSSASGTGTGTGTGLVSKEVEATARARDLSMLQLSNEGEMELSELLAVIEGVKDGLGRLVMTNQLRAQNGLVVAVAVKYQS